MRTLLILAVLATLAGCTRWSMNHHLNSAYRAYDRGDCAVVARELSEVDRASRERRYIQPEVTLLRGLCLEREKLYVDAAQTYQFLINQFPGHEYAYRAQARLETLQKLGYIHQSQPVPLPAGMR